MTHRMIITAFTALALGTLGFAGYSSAAVDTGCPMCGFNGIEVNGLMPNALGPNGIHLNAPTQNAMASNTFDASPKPQGFSIIGAELPAE